MRIKVITIELKVPRWLKLLAPVALVFAIAGITALVKAEQVAPASFADGDTLTAANLNSLRDAIRALANPNCPIGYDKDSTVTAYTVCKKGADELVKVGTGASAFWIDRYEASIWQNADGSGTQYGVASATEFPASFPANGQYTTPLYAISKSGVKPSAYTTWFQADAACEASGKHLPTGWQWVRAARGTQDPGAHPGTGGFCITSASGPRTTGGGTVCSSRWGAQDMIGNLTEWTADWYAGLGDTSPTATWPDTTGGGSFNGDFTSNIASSAWGGSAGPTAGIPAAAIRGGYWNHGSSAGVFALTIGSAPSDCNPWTGFRCVLPGT